MERSVFKEDRRRSAKQVYDICFMGGSVVDL
jgi:hypothetical protein